MRQKIEFDKRLLHSTGLNSSFHGGDGSFQDYLQHMDSMIRLARIDLTPENCNKVVRANCPYEWRPPTKTQKGALLIHGLYDSSYSMMDIGRHLLQRDFLVRSILLPGHGTVPGDLLHVDHREWIKALYFGVSSLAKEVSDIYLVGFSMGAALAAYYALEPQYPIKGMILLAPGLKPRHRFVRVGILLHKMGRFFHESNGWYKLEKQNSYARYECFPYQAAEQGSYLLQKVREKSRWHTLRVPFFMLLSKDDESIDEKAAWTFFKRQKNPQDRLLYYTADHDQFNDSRIIVRSSYFPEQRVLNFSHTGLPMAPHNVHYGINGEFKDFQHYHGKVPPHAEIYQGAITKANLKKYTLQRLSYNPDFDGMIKEIDKFLDTIS